jgi:hypothetical protein
MGDFADATCSEPVASFEACAETPDAVIEWLSAGSAWFEVGSEVDAVFGGYRRCEERDGLRGVRKGPPLDLDRLPEVERSVLGTSLVQVAIATAGGAHLVADVAFRDVASGQSCQPVDTEEGSRCVPASATEVDLYADPTCETEVLQVFSSHTGGQLPLALRRSGEVDACGQPRYASIHHAGDLHEGPLFHKAQLGGGVTECYATERLDLYDYRSVGAEVPWATFAEVVERFE